MKYKVTLEIEVDEKTVLHSLPKIMQKEIAEEVEWMAEQNPNNPYNVALRKSLWISRCAEDYFTSLPTSQDTNILGELKAFRELGIDMTNTVTIVKQKFNYTDPPRKDT